MQHVPTQHPGDTAPPAAPRARRIAARVGFAGLCAAAALVLTAGAAPATPRQTLLASPVGSWTGTVYRTDATELNEVSFHRNGRVCLRTEGGGRGSGTWRRTGADRFSYQVKEELYDGSGTYFGYVLIDQAATQRMSRFTSSGVSQVYAADGTYLGPADARVVARRTSPVPFTC